MSGADSDWYYLDGATARGPFSESELRRRIAGGDLAAETLVAPAGAAEWLPASRALAPISAPPLPPAPAPAAISPARATTPAAPATPVTPAVAAAQVLQLRCLSGPDTGKVFWIGPADAALGAAAGLSVSGEIHVRLVDGQISVRVVTGEPLELDGVRASEATVAAGQRFRFGGALWQVGDRTMKMGELVSALGDRLNSLASVEKLEGFSLGEIFSEAFQRRTPEELDDYFLVGTSRTTPPIDDVATGWPKPWLFLRVLGFLGLLYVALFAAVRQFDNPRLLPGLIMVGSFVVPFSVLVLFFELNTPRNVSFRQLLVLFFLGGVVSLFVSLIGFSVADLPWLGASSAGIIEEIGKLLAVVLIVRGARYRFILNGLLVGAAVGAGFAAFESAGYAFWDALLTTGSIDDATRLILVRALLSPFGHVAWTALAAGALWRVKGARPFAPAMLFDPSFLRAFLIPVGLHMLWNSPLPSPLYVKHLILGFVGWFVVFGFVQQGLRQVKSEQREATRQQLEGTRSLTGAISRAMLAEVAARR